MCEELTNLLRQPSFFNVSGGCGYDTSHDANPCMDAAGIWFKFCPFCGFEIKSRFNGNYWEWWEEAPKLDVLVS